MKQNRFYFFASLVLLMVLFNGCKKTDKAIENEEELITTVQLTFKETGSTNVQVFTFKDIDGPGGTPPTLQDQIVLAPNKQYECSIVLLNESVSPFEDITKEVEAEATDHQFYYTPSNVNITVTNLNTDPSGNPLGSMSRWTTGAASATAGTVKVTLKHKPGIKGASDAITVGDTDVEIDFAAIIQ